MADTRRGAEDGPKRVFRVEYDFQASESVELTVNRGDILLAVQDFTASDEWVIVERVGDKKKGYVPNSYLKELVGSEAAVYLPAPLSSSRLASSTPFKSPRAFTSSASTASTAFKSPRSFASSTLGVRDLASRDAMSTSRIGATPGGISAISSTPAAPGGSESFTEMFARHEQYFKQVMKQREETFKKLEGSIASAAKEISICQEKNSKLSQRISDLDNMIEDERRKWKDRLEAEKKTMLMRSFTAQAI
eukprot:TRINITY_DN12757_c0_g1_i1.p1 TRINITY_DN12757_c0_g1~~TRINITY_DN12757_c0_g1_i1.p1  ORF type:complete len:249 (-),score=58.03 TRINITY_DN12757_c0_g1_i1:57-803(-)